MRAGSRLAAPEAGATTLALPSAQCVVEAVAVSAATLKFVDRADLRRRQVADLRRGGKAVAVASTAARTLGRCRRLDALAEHDEVQERAALAGRQRERVDVRLEVPFVAEYDSGVVEGVEEPVAGEGHRPARLAGVVGVPITVTCGPPTSLLPSSGVATSTHESPAVTMASPLDVLTMGSRCRRIAPSPDWPPKATLIVSGASWCW